MVITALQRICSPWGHFPENTVINKKLPLEVIHVWMSNGVISVTGSLPQVDENSDLPKASQLSNSSDTDAAPSPEDPIVEDPIVEDPIVEDPIVPTPSRFQPKKKPR